MKKLSISLNQTGVLTILRNDLYVLLYTIEKLVIHFTIRVE